MLVEAGKTGCAFDIVLDMASDGDFVVITASDVDRNGGARRGIPQRLKEARGKAEPTLFEVVEKLREAEHRRTVQTNRIRTRALVQNARVDTVTRNNQRSATDSYWALDAKLREADKRREELVRQIRDKAQQMSARVDAVNRTLVRRKSDLDVSISDALVRAEQNRAQRLQDLRQRLAAHDVRVGRIRSARDAVASKATVDAFWQLDAKMSQAARRRERQIEERRDKAGSPTTRIRAIKDQTSELAVARESAFNDKLTSAEERRAGTLNAVKEKAATRSRKVDEVTAVLVRRQSDLDINASRKILRASENRQRHLHSVRDRLKRRSLRSERVRQTKRTLAATD